MWTGLQAVANICDGNVLGQNRQWHFSSFIDAGIYLLYDLKGVLDLTLEQAPDERNF